MKIGSYQKLFVERDSPHGLFLSDGEVDILLPNNQVPNGLGLDDEIEVFIYTDSEDRPIATLKKPYAVNGEFAKMRVVSVSGAGAFLDWGLDKDLFCPFKEQAEPMQEGRDYVVYVYLDEVSNRMSCSSRLSRYLESDGSQLQQGMGVQIVIAEQMPDWWVVVVDNKYKGSIFKDEWHERLQLGDKRQAYIKKIRREDGRIAISLRPQGYEAAIGERDKIINALKKAGGTLPVSDRTSPEEIHQRFGLSKGSFKKLLGTLYKEGIIQMEANSIKLIRWN